MTVLFLLRRLQHLLAGGCELVALLGQAGDDPPAAGDHALAVFLLVALAGVALLGGQFLRECGLRQVGRGVEPIGVILLLLNFVDGFYKLSKLNWHLAYQILMSFCSFAMSVRLIQLILAFRGE